MIVSVFARSFRVFDASKKLLIEEQEIGSSCFDSYGSSIALVRRFECFGREFRNAGFAGVVDGRGASILLKNRTRVC